MWMCVKKLNCKGNCWDGFGHGVFAFYSWTIWLSELPRFCLWDRQVGLSLKEGELGARWRESRSAKMKGGLSGNLHIMSFSHSKWWFSIVNVKRWPEGAKLSVSCNQNINAFPVKPAPRSDVLFEMFDPKKKGEVSYSAPGELWQGLDIQIYDYIWICVSM